MNSEIEDKIDLLMMAGKFVVVGEIDCIHPESGEAWGRETVIIGIHNSRWAANICRRTFIWDEVYGNTIQVLPIKK